MLTKSTKLPLPPALTEQLEQAAQALGSTPASIARAACGSHIAAGPIGR
jgi:hypothetical protein